MIAAGMRSITFDSFSLQTRRNSGLDRFGGFSCNTPCFGEGIGVR